MAVPASALEGIVAVLPAGAPVLLQKPLGEDLAAARRLIALCAARRLRAAVNFQLRFAPCVAAARRLIEAGVEPSVGSVGDSYDNALAETINGLYKAEVIHRRGPWRGLEAVEFATLEWVDWFNNRRILEPIGYVPPAEAERRYYETLGQPAMAA